ncbi:helix-turn-helix domain-containing protein [Arthrobacter sp. OY3WO11]|uniref:helix-turn-helix domain-containing protein n=1 Tax=Arthrobacter sp. OY3WO11 TaxID=1835723 RepID=UPI0007D022EC|nr:helix-turn-helix domain-containing protein [Arthrobacter sp. OY3WO11]OAD97687.1 transcriptional regulator [Arthrobacter sp. OY3WO11]
MAKWTEEMNKTTAPTAAPFPRMLTLDEVQEILNLGKPLVYALVKSGELRAAQFGGRGIWRVRQDDLEAYIDAAYEKTAERIASGQIPDGDIPADG